MTMAVDRLAILLASLAFAGIGMTKLVELPWTPCGISQKSGEAAQHRYLRQPRKLQSEYRVPLFLSLHYVNHEIAVDLEAASEPNDVLSHFCQKVNAQV